MTNLHEFVPHRHAVLLSCAAVYDRVIKVLQLLKERPCCDHVDCRELQIPESLNVLWLEILFSLVQVVRGFYAQPTLLVFTQLLLHDF